MSEVTPAQVVKNFVVAARAVRGHVQHLAVDGIGLLQLVQPFGGATSVLAQTAEVDQKQRNGERNEGETRH